MMDNGEGLAQNIRSFIKKGNCSIELNQDGSGGTLYFNNMGDDENHSLYKTVILEFNTKCPEYFLNSRAASKIQGYAEGGRYSFQVSQAFINRVGNNYVGDHVREKQTPIVKPSKKKLWRAECTQKAIAAQELRKASHELKYYNIGDDILKIIATQSIGAEYASGSDVFFKDLDTANIVFKAIHPKGNVPEKHDIPYMDTASCAKTTTLLHVGLPRQLKEKLKAHYPTFFDTRYITTTARGIKDCCSAVAEKFVALGENPGPTWEPNKRKFSTMVEKGSFAFDPAIDDKSSGRSA